MIKLDLTALSSNHQESILLVSCCNKHHWAVLVCTLSEWMCRIQEYAQSTPAGRLLEDHLLAAGLSVSSSAVAWLTPAQQLQVERELERMEEQLSFETTAWWLSDVLMRARVTNNRMSRVGSNRW